MLRAFTAYVVRQMGELPFFVILCHMNVRRGKNMTNVLLNVVIELDIEKSSEGKFLMSHQLLIFNNLSQTSTVELNMNDVPVRQ